jgi:hypothetical protein
LNTNIEPPGNGRLFIDEEKSDISYLSKIEGVIMKMPPTLSAPICLLVGILLCLPSVVQAEFYKYKDSGGNLIITNRLEDVPKKYRGRVKVVWDEELEAKDPLARRRAAAEKLREQHEQREVRQEQQKSVEKKKSSDDKMLVITIDPDTGEVIRKLE